MLSKKVLIASTIALGIVIAFSSCARKGYGCRGNESWKHLERRINNGF